MPRPTLAFKLPFTHYAELGYMPCPVHGKIPSHGKGWYTAVYDYTALDASGDNVGLRCENIVAFDIDAEEEELAQAIEDVVRQILHLPADTPIRVGQAPKRLLIARVAQPTRGFDLGHRDPDGRGITLFQLLGAGKQFVVHGIHPVTQKPYSLSAPLPAWKDLPMVRPEELAAMREAVGGLLINKGYRLTGSTNGDAKETGEFSGTRWQSETELDNVLAAVLKIDPRCDRATWIKVGMSLHDGFHGGADGFDLFNAWSSGELHGTVVEAPKYKGERDCWRNWNGFKPGKGVHTGTLFWLAEKGDFQVPTDAYEVPTDPDPIGADLWNVDEVAFRALPQWMIDDLIHRKGVVLMYGESGCGKSALAVAIAMGLAGGADVLGDLQVRQPGGVLYFALEGNLPTRTRPYYVEGLVRKGGVRARFEQAITLTADSEAEGLRHIRDRLAQLKELDPDLALVVVDTLARAGEVDENSADLGKIAEYMHQIAEEFDVAVIVIHHSGKDVSKGARGHSSLRAAVDTEICVEVEKVDNKVARRWFTVTKQREAEQGLTREFELQVVELERDPVTGRMVTGIYTTVGEEPQRRAGPRVPQGKVQGVVYKALRWLLSKASGTPRVNLQGVGWAVPTDALLADASSRLPEKRDDRGRDRRRELVRQALTALSADLYIHFGDHEGVQHVGIIGFDEEQV